MQKRLLALLVVGLSSCGDAQNAVSGPDVSLTVRRSKYIATNDVNSPSWALRATIKNTSATEWELGEQIAVIETIADTSAAMTALGIDDASFHVIRRRAKDESVPSFSDRYVTLFGYAVDPDGSTFIPFAALNELTGNRGSMSLFIASLASPRLEVHKGGGFGRLGARAQHVIEADVISPLGPKKRGDIVVLLPSFTPASGTNRVPRHIWYEFPAMETKEGDTLVRGVRHEAPRTGAALAKDARDQTLPSWRRRLALNWLVEDFPNEAGTLIAELLKESDRRSLFRSAVANAGRVKAREATPTLTSLLATETNIGLSIYLIDALGLIGDVSAAPEIRNSIDAKAEGVSRAAVLALGNLKDTASLPRLMARFRAAKDFRAANVVATAVLLMDADSATQELVGALANQRTAELPRRAVADALTPAVAQRFGSQLSALLLDPKTPNVVATDVAEAMARGGDDAALITLRRVADEGKDDFADGAIRALVRHDRKAWRDTVIALAGSSQAKHRRKAIYYLGIFDVKAAAPVMREATTSTDAEVKKAACAALESLKEPKLAACGA